jgi:hypothetical protein
LDSFLLTAGGRAANWNNRTKDGSVELTLTADKRKIIKV